MWNKKRFYMVDISYLTTGKIGAKLDRVDAAPQFALGELAIGNNGSRWVYCKSSGILAQYLSVSIDSNFLAQIQTDALAAKGNMWGVPQIAVADASYFWCPVAGTGFLAKVKASTPANVKLYTSGSGGSAGNLRATSATSGVVLGGVTITVAASASAGTSGLGLVRNVLANNPAFIL